MAYTTLLVLKFVDQRAYVRQNFYSKLITLLQRQFRLLEDTNACRRASDDDGTSLQGGPLRQMRNELRDTEDQVVDTTVLNDFPVVQPSKMELARIWDCFRTDDGWT